MHIEAELDEIHAERLMQLQQRLQKPLSEIIAAAIDSMAVSQQDILQKPVQTSSIDDCLAALTPQQREAYDYLDKVRIDWGGKPITDREEANARR